MKLNKPQLEEVTLDYTFYGGSFSVGDETNGDTGGSTNMRGTTATGQVAFAVGETEKQVKIQIWMGENDVERNISFTFALSNLTNAVFEDGSTRYERAVYGK